MRANHLERRAKKYAARQYVSETHDHKPDAKADLKEAFTAFKAIIRRAVMTLLTLRDPDRKYQVRSSAWLFPVVNEAQESYGYVRYGFEPTAHDISQMEVIAGWLAWLRRTEGQDALRRIVSWTLGVPCWRIATRERCSERAILYRLDASIASILRRFGAVDIDIEQIAFDRLPQATQNGKSLGPVPPYTLEFHPQGPHGEAVLKKVYIHDRGFMLGSRKLRNGHEKVEKFMRDS